MTTNKQKLFSSVFFLFGLAYIALLPPGEVPDEKNHFLRAFQISQGDLMGIKLDDHQAGGYLPTVVQTDISKFDDLISHKERQLTFQEWKFRMDSSTHLTKEALDQKGFVNFPPMVLYSPLLYVPQVIGIEIAKAMSATVLQALYLARLMGLLLSTLLFYYCCENVFVIFLVAMPTCLTQMSSTSSDLVTDWMAIVSTLLVFSLMKRWERKKFLAFLLAAAGLSLCKTFYTFISLAIFGIPEARKKAIPILVAVFLPGFLWTLSTKHLYIPFEKGNVPEQIAFLTFHPLAFASVLWESVTSNFRYYFHSFVGLMGYLDAPVPFWFFELTTVLLICVGASVAKVKLTRFSMRLNFLIIGLTLFLIFFSQYIYWTEPGLDHIEGVQGRYFIPLAVLALFSLPKVSSISLFERASFQMFWWVISFVVGARSLMVRFWV